MHLTAILDVRSSSATSRRRRILAPLEGLEWAVPELNLGLVHASDEERAKERIAATREVPGRESRVITECGLGLSPKKELGPTLKTVRILSASVLKEGIGAQMREQ
jgi:hypothetical protein